MTLSTSDAVIKGVVEDGVGIFRGIVYASYERFKPAELKPLSGEVDATRYGTLCPQRSSRLASLLGDIEGFNMSEGELCLSIYAPASPDVSGVSCVSGISGVSGHQGISCVPDSPSARDIPVSPGAGAAPTLEISPASDTAEMFPVMVWIHGGAYLTGGSEDPRYGAERLVRAGGVVVVKISYRLGAEANLYAPEHAAVNLGLDDQWKALRWIHDHIALFGGDPKNVTLFGQSAGAHSIQCLIATCDRSPVRLFHKAILQSSPFGITITPRSASRVARIFVKALRHSVFSSTSSSSSSSSFESSPPFPAPACHASDSYSSFSVNALSCSEEAVLRNATMEQFMDAQQACSHLRPGMTFMPVLSDYMRVPESARGLSVVIGCTAQDVSPFLLPSLGRLAATAFGRGIVALLTRAVFISGARRYASRLREGSVHVQSYLATWHPEGSVLGACHCIELPFILGKYEDWQSAEMLKGMTREEFDAHSRSCLHAWTSFARTGVFPPLSI